MKKNSNAKRINDISVMDDKDTKTNFQALVSKTCCMCSGRSLIVCSYNMKDERVGIASCTTSSFSDNFSEPASSFQLRWHIHHIYDSTKLSKGHADYSIRDN